MNVEIRTRGFSLTSAMRTYVERRLELALDRHRDRIGRVRVTVRDVNGPKGGQDKCCRIELRLRGGRTVCTRVVDGDAYVAAGAAAHRAGRAVARAVQRERATMLELVWLAQAIARKPSVA